MNKNESPVFTKWWYWVSFIILAILSLPTDAGTLSCVPLIGLD
ncbi:hypothetical protein [Fructilactobacillus lindneri]|nr:hypothetical protein [Fructilactobacillus lindneri]